MDITTQFIKVAAERDDGGVSIVSVITVGRGDTLPFGAQWMDQKQGIWARSPTDAVIESDLKRAVPGMVAWHRLADDSAQHDRDYRDALVVADARLVHDMPRAREVHRRALRHERARAFVTLDADFTRAVGQANQAGAAAVEVLRQRWRDAPADPRIDAAATVDELRALLP